MADLRALRPDLIAVSGDLTERAFQLAVPAERAASWTGCPRRGSPAGQSWTCRSFCRCSSARAVRSRASPSTSSRTASRCARRARPGWLASGTAHGKTWKDGAIQPDLLDGVDALRGGAARGAPIVIAHHPFQPPPDDPRYRLVDGWEAGLRRLSAAGVDMVLGGHIRRAYAVDVAGALGLGRPLLVVQSADGGLTPHLRDRPNGYNLLRLDGARVEIAARYWVGRGFVEEVLGHWTLAECSLADPKRRAVA
ncbi:metallophosphoesterase family protein [Caulobacter segnis]